jgi:hypothetical protein
MFQENPIKPQLSFFSLQSQLPATVWSTLQQSWAHTFRLEIFDRIPEEMFAVLYSTTESRPNTPVNILIGAEIMKAGMGWSDEQMMANLQFDLQTRYALRLDDLHEAIHTRRTVYNFRKRLRDHLEQTGEDLLAKLFATITDEQMKQFNLLAGWQRMDSTQLWSNLARLSRFELAVATLQQGVKALPAQWRDQWQAEHSFYLERTPQNISYRLKKEETEAHLLRLGELLGKLVADLQASESDMSRLALVQRLLAEQYQGGGAEPLQLKPPAELVGGQLQSPHDPEATYRSKNGAGHVGYVANVTETCDPTNSLQLITNVEVAPNNADDGHLLAQAVADLRQREVGLQQVTTDGGYNGVAAEEACTTHKVEFCPTTLRGGTSSPDRFGWEVYEVTWDEAGQPHQVTCPEGQTVLFEQGQKADWFNAEFDPARCAACPFFGQQCRVVQRKTKPPVLRVQRQSLRVARLRRNAPPNNYAIRANVEATIHAFTHSLREGKLATRGLFGARRFAYGSALMVNLRRIHAYYNPENTKGGENGLQNGRLSIFLAFYRGLALAWAALWGHLGVESKPDGSFDTVYPALTSL